MGPPKGAFGADAIDVDVNPLVIVGGLGKEIDTILGDLDPVAAGEPLSAETGRSSGSSMVVDIVSLLSSVRGGPQRVLGGVRLVDTRYFR
ncbi:hypothetical protein [Rhodococcus aetherivorans]|uniref:hypothetical protein n=1 Tax=Rhodococcus aetherivorans TaxID=191292 RepID=UPI001B2FE8D3